MRFKDVILAAFGYVFEYRRPLAKALLIPFVVYLITDALMLLEPDLAVSLALWITTVVVQTVFAITTHRIILLGPGAVPEWGIFKWSRRETRFALHMLGLGLVVIPAVILGFIPLIGGLIALGVIFWLFSRLSLVFPAIAIDHDASFRSSWELTRDRQMLMFLVVMVFPALLAIPAYALSFIPYTFILTSSLTTFLTVFMVAALSVTYRLVCREEDEGTPGTAD